MLSLSLHHLQVFLAAAETLNFTQAAQQLQMSQPSVSQNIQALEEHFGMSLFARAGRTLALTEAGLVLEPMAREVVNLAHNIEETMVGLQGDVQGHLQIGCGTLSGRYLLPKLLAVFHQQYPRVRVTCHVDSHEQVLEMLAAGKIQLAMTTEPVSSPDFEQQPVMVEKIILIAPPRHSWAERGQIEISELYTAPFILPTPGSTLHTILRQHLAQHDLSIEQFQPSMRLGSLEAIALSVQEGLGAGFVPELIASRLLGKAARVEVNGLRIESQVCLGRNLRRTATGAQTAFWNFVVNQSLPDSIGF